MSSNPSSLPLPLQHQLLGVARRAIQAGLRNERFVIRLGNFPEELRQKRATFVTLECARQLRGCVGTLEPHRALVDDVAQNAYQAAFGDPRFPPLTPEEFESLDIHLSILTLPQPMTFVSEADLLRQLQPHVDGLVFEDGRFRSTFLPAVWDHFPNPRDFFSELKRKAGLPADYWSDTVTVRRYTVESIP